MAKTTKTRPKFKSENFIQIPFGGMEIKLESILVLVAGWNIPKGSLLKGTLATLGTEPFHYVGSYN